MGTTDIILSVWKNLTDILTSNKNNMNIELKDGHLTLTEVYNSITIKTNKGRELYICLRDFGWEMKIDDGEWHLITNEEDFK
jgi:hypothetical protein